jgi:predicted pyridoxine 5'-phosphate oxidase superfamily flavin-nucleotide-binding protein
MPEQHHQFYESLPFLVAAACNDQGQMWLTLLTNTLEGSDKFVKSPTATSLSIQGGTIAGDVLDGFLSSGTDLGILGIEFATKRCNQVNGHIIDSTSSGGTLNF